MIEGLWEVKQGSLRTFQGNGIVDLFGVLCHDGIVR